MIETFVTPQCCQEARDYAAVVLHLNGDGTEGQKPRWVTRGWNKESRSPCLRAAKFCPFCGARVPDIVPSGIKEKICKITDGGYYCDTCEQRLIACECLPPEFAWKPDEKATYTFNVTTLEELFTAASLIGDDEKAYILGKKLKEAAVGAVKLQSDIEKCHGICTELGAPEDLGGGTNGLRKRLEYISKAYF